MQSARRPDPALVRPAATVAAVGGAVLLWRVLTWQSAVSPDAWAYAAWGQALAGFERPLFELSETTPKPLATLLGALVAPVPGERAFAVVVALALAALAAALFAAAHREGGAVAGAVAVVALAAGAQLMHALVYAYVDIVVAAFVLAGIAVRGRLRIAALVLAGLLRPEAWPLAAVAGFSEARGSWKRRVGGALLAGACAPVFWILIDLALTGDPFGTQNWRSERHAAEGGLSRVPWLEVPRMVLVALRGEGGIVLLVVGILGLVLHAIGVRRRGVADPLPIAVVVVWSLLLALETRYGIELNPRYLFVVVAVLALGCAYLVAACTPSRLWIRSPWPAVAVGVAALVVVAVTADFGAAVSRSIARNDAVAAMGPSIEAVRSCGRLGVAGGRVARATLPMLAASSRRSMHDFGLYPEEKDFAGVVGVRRTPRAPLPALPPWERRETPLGPLAVAPGCAAP